MENSWMSLSNCGINLILTWSTKCFIIDAPIVNRVLKFTITNSELFVPVAILSIQDNENLL